VRKDPKDLGVSDALGAVVLISVVALGITIAVAALLSQPNSQKIPAVSVEITTFTDGIRIYHAGGDILEKGDVAFIVSGVDKSDSFVHRDGSTWSTWSAGESLYYNTTGQVLPSEISLVFKNTGGAGQISEVFIIPTPVPGAVISLPA